MQMDQAVAQFIQQHTGKDAIFQGCPTNSCMALMHLFAFNILGIPDPNALAVAFAYMLSANYPNYNGATFFTFIANTPNGIPPAGAFVLWKASAVVGVPEGHVSLSLGGGNVNTFQSFDANWTTQESPTAQPKIVTHDYTDVAGWLVPNNTVPNFNVLYPPPPVPVQTPVSQPVLTNPPPAASGGQLPNLSLPGSPDATVYGNVVTKSDNFDAVSSYMGMSSQQAVQVDAGQTVVQQITKLQATIRVQNAQIAGLRTLVTRLTPKAAPAPAAQVPSVPNGSSPPGPVATPPSVSPLATFKNGQPAVSGTQVSGAPTSPTSQNGAQTLSGKPSYREFFGTLGAVIRTILW